MSVVGFSGTRHGMTQAQARAVLALLEELGATEVHHGDCVGADAEVNTLALLVGARRVGHPPVNARYRAYCVVEEDRPPEAFLIRDQDIVNDSPAMIFAPFEDAEQPRGGTWATVRMARQASRRRAIVNRDGSVVREWWEDGR